MASEDTYLFSEAKATEKERHAQDKQEVGENRAKKRGLYDADFVLFIVSMSLAKMA